MRCRSRSANVTAESSTVPGYLAGVYHAGEQSIIAHGLSHPGVRKQSQAHGIVARDHRPYEPGGGIVSTWPIRRLSGFGLVLLAMMLAMLTP